MVLAFMTLYCKHLGYTTKQGGLVVGIYGIGSIAGAFLGGKVTDKFGFYYTQFTALVLGGCMFILLGQMNTFPGICAGTFLLSLVNESFRPANAAAIAHYSNPKNRTQSFSLVRLAINIGWGIGVAVGGLLASFNYHLLFWADGFTSILAGISLLIILPRVHLGQQINKGSQQEMPVSNSAAHRDPGFLQFLFLTVLFAICFFQMFTTVPVYFKESLKLNEFWIGAVMSLNGLLIALIEMVLVFKLEGRKPYLTLMCFGSVLMALAFFLLNLPIANGLVIALCYMPFMNSYYISRSSDSNRGQYTGLYTMSWSLAQVIGSSCGAMVAANFGFFNLWLGVGGICLFAAAGYHWLQKRN
jgi:predicted MFS family arabinose efflux permease